jgi:hypothetical protein
MRSEIDFDPMNIYDGAVRQSHVAQVPAPDGVDLDDQDTTVGVSPVWRAGKKFVGTYLPWRFGHGEPFHAGLGGEL